jgi:hypothetical protein
MHASLTYLQTQLLHCNVYILYALQTPYTTCWDAFIGVGGVPSAKVNTATVTNIAPVAQQQQQYNSNGQSVPVPATSNSDSQGQSSGSSHSTPTTTSSSGAPCDAKCEHGILDYKTGACCSPECGECESDTLSTCCRKHCSLHMQRISLAGAEGSAHIPYSATSLLLLILHTAP